jgi:hypothetical protein
MEMKIPDSAAISGAKTKISSDIPNGVVSPFP